MARQIRTPVSAPAYYLGRPADVYRTALGTRRRSRPPRSGERTGPPGE